MCTKNQKIKQAHFDEQLSEEQHRVQSQNHLFSFNRCLSEGPWSPGKGPHYTLERSLVYYSTRAHTQIYTHAYKHTRGIYGVSNPADVHVNGVWDETKKDPEPPLHNVTCRRHI